MSFVFVGLSAPIIMEGDLMWFLMHAYISKFTTHIFEENQPNHSKRETLAL